MGHDFDRDDWERRWVEGGPDGPGSMAAAPPNPHLVRESADLAPGTALDAGCGAGAEAHWLAAQGWRVTAVDLSTEALARAAARGGAGAADPAYGAVEWVEADLTTWVPARRFDLVTTHYAHPAMPQHVFYDRLSAWVAPGGTLLVVGHLHGHGDGDGDRHHPREETTVTTEDITARLDPERWEVVTAEVRDRRLPAHAGHTTELHDVVVRARRRR